jgi:hypothetical protein
MDLTTAEKLLALERIARGQMLVSSGRGLRSLRINRAELRAFEQAKKTGYLVRRGEMPSLYQIWWYWCQATKQPFVAIKCRRRRAFIEFELVDPAAEITKEGLALMDETLRAHSSVSGPVGYGTGARACAHPNVRVEIVEDLAMDLLRIARDQSHPVPVAW